DLEELSQLSHLNVVGLMTIPPFGQSSIDIASVFNRTRQLATQIRAQGFSNIQMQELSMGMSGDYPLAIEAGATMVRVGRTIFGERPQ
ncbi:MAG: alanine racemase, partial [Cyanobacteria bacterium J06649_11]